MVVTEIFISALVTVLFEKLASGELLNLARRQGIYSHIETWSLTLEKVEAVLGDAEEKQITDKPVNKWLEQLQDLAYDLDDILDELATEALSRKLMQESQISTSKLRRLVPACCTTSNFSPRVVKFDFKMKSKIDSITTRLQDLVKQKNELSLSVHVGGSSLKRTGHERLPTTSLVDESGVYGREEDKRAILDQMSLGAVQHSDRKVRVIAIVGMGGIGKTTLAQQVYNDEKVKSCFHLKAWVCISDVFDEFLITKIIFEALSAESRDFKDLNMAQVKLQEILSNKKFLLVFDDVWNENYGKWDLLSRPFHVGAPGSTIIATTRNVGVASIMRSVPDYHLERLEDEDICSIVAQLALGTHDFEAHPDFKQIGEAIVEKCKGLSLAAKTLGSLLRTKVSPNEWKDILNSKLWDLPKPNNDILPALRLSYHHLPSHLKCLFAYCSIFPKDYEFDKYELVLLWMAEGFLKQSENPKEMEDVGFCYFDELLGRSRFQCSSSRQSRFLMHDLVNDLAQHVAGRICFRLDNKTESNMRHSVFLQKARHSSFVRHEYEVFQRFEAFNRAPNLRTFLPLPVFQTSQGFYLTKQVSSDLLPQLLRLQVLSFSGYSICELPNSIGNLKHLRYLNLSDTRVKELPESVSELYNLQTFALRCCKQLAKLPKNTGNLINLRHLDIAGTSQLKEMPLGIGKLTSLQTLSKIVLDRSRGLRVNELRGLSNLRGALSIIGLHSVMKVQDAVEANLLRKQGLDELEMEWSTGFDGFRNKRTEKEVFDVLKPSTNLRALKVESYGGIEFPSWLGDPSFSSLACMTLRGCKECISLPSLGHLPSLKELRIKGMDGVKNVGAELCGIISPQVKAAFPALTILEFDNMVGLVEWSTNLSNDVENVRQVFPSLRELRLSDCPNLIRVSLPRLPSLRVLNISRCQEVVLTSVVALASATTTLRIRGISGLSQLREGVLQFLGKSLEVLLIYGCPELITLWEGEHACANLSSLRNLEVGNCFGLVSLLGEDEQELPQNLERLELWYCKNLEKLPDGLKSLKSLRALIIGECPRLDFFLTTTELEVQSSINNDDKYENALMERFSRLETFEIQDCPSMTIFPLGQNISTTLKTLRVKDCKNLEPDSETMWLLKSTMPSSSLVNIDIRGWENLKLLPGNLLRFVHLTGLHISACLSLESFPESVALPPGLVNLSIGNCRNLKYLLPDDHYQMQSLTSLLYLNIYDCPSLELFPRRCWPPNLESLRLGGDFKRPSSGWEPQRLPTSLSRLILFGGSSGDDLYSSLVLHNHSLTTLEIKEFSYLEKLLPKGLQTLKSLEHLWISACPKLRCLPDTLLPRLSGLYIRDCPLLKGRCLREKRDYWPMISLIPFVKIDHVLL